MTCIQQFVENIYEKHVDWTNLIQNDDNFKNILELDNPAEMNYKLNTLALKAGYRDQSSLEKLIVEVEEPFPFRVCLNEKNFIYDCEFRKHFKIHNFKTCVDRSKNIDDLVFEEHFENRRQTFDSANFYEQDRANVA